jgi:hypothetical protein
MTSRALVPCGPVRREDEDDEPWRGRGRGRGRRARPPRRSLRVVPMRRRFGGEGDGTGCAAPCSDGGAGWEEGRRERHAAGGGDGRSAAAWGVWQPAGVSRADVCGGAGPAGHQEDCGAGTRKNGAGRGGFTNRQPVTGCR